MLFAIVLFIFVVHANSQNASFILRRANGDVMFLNRPTNESVCAKYSAVVDSSQSCRCNSHSTFYSEQNKVEQCWKGFGQTGCHIGASGDRHNVHSLERTMSQFSLPNTLHCREFPTGIFLEKWSQQTGFTYLENGTQYFLITKVVEGESHRFKLLFRGGIAPESYDGSLLKFHLQLCSYSLCFLMKVVGKDEWDPYYKVSTVVPSISSVMSHIKSTHALSVASSLRSTRHLTPKRSQINPSASVMVTNTQNFFRNIGNDDDDDDDDSRETLILVLTFTLVVVIMVAVFLLVYCLSSRKKSVEVVMQWTAEAEPRDFHAGRCYENPAYDIPYVYEGAVAIDHQYESIKKPMRVEKLPKEDYQPPMNIYSAEPIKR